MRVLGISGSLREGSYNTELLRAAAKLLPPGAHLEVYKGLGDIPPYSEDAEHQTPPAVAALKQAIADADAVLFSTPEYNHSLPGQLKNALDWASRPFPENALQNRPVAVVGASTGAYGAMWAQAELRKVLGAIGARVVEGGVAVAQAHERFNAEGDLVDGEVREQLAEVLRNLVAAARPAAVAA